VEELRIKLNLPETDAYKRFYIENVNKVLIVNHEFLNSVAMQNDVWKRPNLKKDIFSLDILVTVSIL